MKARQKQTTPSMTAEQILDAHWKDKLGQNTSAFTNLVQFASLRGEERLVHIRDYIAQRIFAGLPLAKDDYHHAIAFHFLLTELPYHEFYTIRWHETANHLGYGPTCTYCEEDPT